MPEQVGRDSTGSRSVAASVFYSYRREPDTQMDSEVLMEGSVTGVIGGHATAAIQHPSAAFQIKGFDNL